MSKSMQNYITCLLLQDLRQSGALFLVSAFLLESKAQYLNGGDFVPLDCRTTVPCGIANHRSVL
jgi:hypothetical protein